MIIPKVPSNPDMGGSVVVFMHRISRISSSGKPLSGCQGLKQLRLVVIPEKEAQAVTTHCKTRGKPEHFPPHRSVLHVPDFCLPSLHFWWKSAKFSERMVLVQAQVGNEVSEPGHPEEEAEGMTAGLGTGQQSSSCAAAPAFSVRAVTPSCLTPVHLHPPKCVQALFS